MMKRIRRLIDSNAVYMLPLLASLVLRLLWLTLRVKVVDRPKLAADERVIHAFWHNRILLMPYARLSKTPHTVMISRHRDGELVSRLVGWMGISSSRGSTTRGGTSALKELIRLAKAGHNIVFTPDGPKGPRYVSQPGTVQAARATGLPIFAITYGALKKKLLNPGTAS